MPPSKIHRIAGALSMLVARLAPIIEKARAVLQSFEHAPLQWIPRRRNAQADALARAALGMAPRRAGTPSRKLPVASASGYD